MIKLNRTTEYGLMALRHISRQGQEKRSSAREIADLFGLPFEITAKTLQRLKETGLIQSSQGAHGGYRLERRLLEDVTLAQFLQLMEGPQHLVGCNASEPECEYNSRCEIKGMMGQLNIRILGFLSEIRLADLIGEASACGAGEAPAKRA